MIVYECVQRLWMNVSGNRLGSWAVPKGSFPLLRVLKAAGCSFHTQCLHQLAVLPSLTDLHLPNNQIATVPEGMADNRPFLLLQVSNNLFLADDLPASCRRLLNKCFLCYNLYVHICRCSVKSNVVNSICCKLQSLAKLAGSLSSSTSALFESAIAEHVY